MGALGGFLTGNVARVITGRLCSYLCVLFSLVKSRKRTKKQPDEQKWNEKPSQMGFSLDSGRKEVSTIYWQTLWETWTEVWLLKKKNQCGPLGLIVINHCECYWSKYCICAISNCILLLLEKPIKKPQNCLLLSKREYKCARCSPVP